MYFPILLKEAHVTWIMIHDTSFSRTVLLLGADTRATEGPIVATKNCLKIHFMAPHIYCIALEGTAADTEDITDTTSLSSFMSSAENKIIGVNVSVLSIFCEHTF